ncbi:MAG: hypothetical protein ACK4Q5_09485 [Saprospiraceae bacterium]
MTITVELLNEKTLALLRDLEQLSLLRVLSTNAGSKSKVRPVRRAAKKFTAVQLDTHGFKFNRQEANER